MTYFWLDFWLGFLASNLSSGKFYAVAITKYGRCFSTGRPNEPTKIHYYDGTRCLPAQKRGTGENTRSAGRRRRPSSRRQTQPPRPPVPPPSSNGRSSHRLTRLSPATAAESMGDLVSPWRRWRPAGRRRGDCSCSCPCRAT
ncbi:hypothetical protein B0T24DRAFT_620061 [Lasiosphaeria ovina]|uniref:Uncharacterized protein n=1 Tax=Lasiosphaeria ovina TaxID=92902 RepID=A0AAE0KHL1_9PEZI|nr:hypothetical protein B0T24DRAFT_620061 [Lasiosphaeria ovina]